MLPKYFWEQDCIATPNNGHRLWLSRAIPPTGPRSLDMVIFLMLNPSKARGEGVGDPTQRKCGGFAHRLGARKYGLINLFSRSTPYPEELFMFGYEDAVGKLNDFATQIVFEQAATRGWPVIAAWGKPNLPVREKPFLTQRTQEVSQRADITGLTLNCLATTPDGSPRHPLMLGYENAKLQPWTYL